MFGIDPNCGCSQHGHPGWHNAPPGCVCICGRDGRSEAPANSYRSKMGSDIKSVLGGIGHGALHFFVGSLQDLQTTAVYIGSAELEISLHERIHMIEAVEQLQIRQMAAVEGRLLGMLSIDESDSIYHSFRSTATTGLEIGSLIAGGCGAVKGVISFNKLSKVPLQASRIATNLLRETSSVVKELKPNKSGHLQRQRILYKMHLAIGKIMVMNFQNSRTLSNMWNKLIIFLQDQEINC